jgi:hypothetical protein
MSKILEATDGGRVQLDKGAVSGKASGSVQVKEGARHCVAHLSSAQLRELAAAAIELADEIDQHHGSAALGAPAAN